MNSSPLVSIIIPCYQQQEFLARALNSIEEQQFKSIEVIIVDDGSKPEIVIPQNNFLFNITLLKQSNKGLSSARNKGIKQAKGQWIKFLDADDILLPYCIQSQVDSLSNSLCTDKKVSMIGYIEEDDDTGTRVSTYPSVGNPQEAILLVNIAPVHSFLYPLSLIKSLGGYDESDRVNGGHEDYDLNLRIFSSGSLLVCLQQLGVVYYKRSGSMSSNHQNMLSSRINVWCYNINNFLNVPKLLPNILSASIIAWCRLVDYTINTQKTELTNKLQGKLLSQISLFCQSFEVLKKQQKNSNKLNRLNKLMITSEVHRIVKKLVQFNIKEITPLITILIAEYGRDSNAPLLISPQAIIDRRLLLAKEDEIELDEKWLLQVFHAVSNSENGFVIYGAGSVAKKLLTLFEPFGYKPKAFIDKNAENISSFECLPVLSLAKLNSVKIDLVIISIFPYREAIVKDIKQVNAELVVY